MKNNRFTTVWLLLIALLAMDDVRLRQSNRTVTVERNLLLSDLTALRQESPSALPTRRGRGQRPAMQEAQDDNAAGDTGLADADHETSNTPNSRRASAQHVRKMENRRRTHLQDTVTTFAAHAGLSELMRDRLLQIMEDAADARQAHIEQSQQDGLTPDDIQAELTAIHADTEADLRDLLGSRDAERFLDEFRTASARRGRR